MAGKGNKMLETNGVLIPTLTRATVLARNLLEQANKRCITAHSRSHLPLMSATILRRSLEVVSSSPGLVLPRMHFWISTMLPATALITCMYTYELTVLI